MLNKRICKICIEKHRISPWSFNKFWHDYKECWCPYNNHPLPSIKTAPPENCVYFLEQTVHAKGVV